jgi:glycerophosphoryl diester phosphodiesterase
MNTLLKTTLACVLSLSLIGICRCEENAPRLMAHRGGSLEADENTMPAFQQAYEKGLRSFETDVHLTSDDQLVIIHDDTFDRTTNAKGSVEAATAEQVKAIRTQKTGSPLPFLSDMLNYFKDKPDIFIELEMKTNPQTYSDERLKVYCQKLHDAVKGVLPDKCYSFTSFDMRALKIMHAIDPTVTLTMILDVALGDAQIKTALDMGCKRISPILDLTTRKAVRDAKKAGLEVTGWPGTSEKDLALAKALGLDCLCTDIPVQLHTGKKMTP